MMEREEVENHVEDTHHIYASAKQMISLAHEGCNKCNHSNMDVNKLRAERASYVKNIKAQVNTWDWQMQSHVQMIDQHEGLKHYSSQ